MDTLYTERQILGIMLMDKEFLQLALDKLDQDCFDDEKNKVVFTSISNMETTDNVDVVSVIDAMKSMGTLSKVGPNYIYDLVGEVVSTTSGEAYLKRLKRYHLIKDNTKLAKQGIQLLQEEKIEEAKGLFSNIDLEQSDEKDKSIAEIEKDFEEYLNTELEEGINTEYTELDNILGGIYGGDLVIVAARPAMGKSAFAVNLMERLALNKQGVVLFSFEMSSQQLFSRMVSIHSRINMENIIKKTFTDYEKKKMIRDAVELKNSPMYIFDRSDLATVGGVARTATKLAQKNPISMIVIDYLQLMSVPGMSGENRNAEVSKITRGLKLLAKELNVPILLLSQLSRASEKRTDKRPILSDLRDSGAVEQDADIVMFLHRPSYYKEDDKPGICEVNVAKHRQGPTGTAELSWVERYTAFENLERNCEE